MVVRGHASDGRWIGAGSGVGDGAERGNEARTVKTLEIIINYL